MEGKGMTAYDRPSPEAVAQEDPRAARPNDAVAGTAADIVGSMAPPDGEKMGFAPPPDDPTGTAGARATSGGNEQDVSANTPAPDAQSAPAPEPATPEPAASPSASPAAAPAAALPRARVDARLLEATLLNLRKRVAAIPLSFGIPGADEVALERAKILSQIDDYLLPRVRQSEAPILVALVGSTGAGKSTLVNSIVGTQVSLTGVRRPTTNSPVLACHPDDIHWFAENMFLPTLPRVRQEGLARPGRDGLLVLAAVEGMAKGIALLDTPDIDSVAASHREFAYQFLDASDLWLFMTSASRYADAPVWEILQHARERGAALGVVLSRVPPSHRGELVGHFNAMLDANGIAASNRFVIPETGVVNNMLPDDVFQPIRDWLTETAQGSDRRVAVLSQTMSGVLDTFKTRVPALAAHVDAQVSLATRLRGEAESAYATAISEFDRQTRDAHLLRGEVLARWQDYAASGDLTAELRGKRTARKGRRARKGTGNARATALDAALRAAIASLVVSVADRAAEQVTRAWRADPAGAVLLSSAEATRVRGERAEREFESAFGPAPEAGLEGEPAAGLDRSAPELPDRVARAVSGWQDHLIRLVETDNSKIDGGALSLVTLIAMLGDGGDHAEEIVTEPKRMLAAAYGAVPEIELLARARSDLAERIRLTLDEELLRYVVVLDAAGVVDPIAAVRLYQAEYSLEAAR
jgi:energy-coupling factor transporter ATP-binding protein EcfA2